MKTKDRVEGIAGGKRRRPYTPPELTELGNVEKLTQSRRILGSPDGGGFGFKPRGT